MLTYCLVYAGILLLQASNLFPLNSSTPLRIKAVITLKNKNKGFITIVTVKNNNKTTYFFNLFFYFITRIYAYNFNSFTINSFFLKKNFVNKIFIKKNSTVRLYKYFFAKNLVIINFRKRTESCKTGKYEGLINYNIVRNYK